MSDTQLDQSAWLERIGYAGPVIPYSRYDGEYEITFFAKLADGSLQVSVLDGIDTLIGIEVFKFGSKPAQSVNGPFARSDFNTVVDNGIFKKDRN